MRARTFTNEVTPSHLALTSSTRLASCMPSPAMPRNRRLVISSREASQQARFTELVAAILEAATQVSAKEGATRFTAARVAERADVSVSSIYQYFPNVAATLFRLQADEWKRKSAAASPQSRGRRRRTETTRMPRRICSARI